MNKDDNEEYIYQCGPITITTGEVLNDIPNDISNDISNDIPNDNISNYNNTLPTNTNPNSTPKKHSLKLKAPPNSRKRKSQQLSSSILLLKNLIEDYKNNNEIKNTLKNIINNKNSDQSRSIQWRIFLNTLNLSSHLTWDTQLKASRYFYYNKLKIHNSREFLEFIYFDKEKQKISNFYSKFNQEFIENLNVIKIDVERTFQEIDLFRDEDTKSSLLKILYIWAVENSDLGYVQGMNEILGTLYYSLYPSLVAENNISNNLNIDKLSSNDSIDNSNGYSSIYYTINSQEHFEADLYQLFDTIMSNGFKSLYNYNDIKYKESYKHGLVDGFEIIDKNYMTLEDIYNSNLSPLKKRINKIFFVYLKIVDEKLFNHLNEKVEPYLFIFRWILCILNREMNLKSLMHVWDCIFAMEYMDNIGGYKDSKDSNNSNSNICSYNTYLNFLDFISISMILSMKDELIQDDDECYILSLLMHFPNENKMKEIIYNALAVRDKIYDYYKIQNEYHMVDHFSG